MYYLSMHVAPPWGQDRDRKIKQALAHFWIDAKNGQGAAHQAKDYLEQRQWNILSIQEKPCVVNDHDEAHGCMGLSQSHRARIYGLSLCLTDYVYEGG